MRKKILNLVILVVALFLFNFDGVNAESSTLTCKYSSDDGKNAATVTYDFGKEKKRRVKITKYAGEKRDGNDEEDLNGKIYNWVVKYKRCPEYLRMYNKNANFKAYSGKLKQVNTWALKQSSAKSFYLPYKESSLDKNSNLVCNYEESESYSQTTAIITFDKNNPPKYVENIKVDTSVLIKEILGENVEKMRTDLNELSYYLAINNGECPQALGIYDGPVGYKTYSGKATDVAKWVESNRGVDYTVLLKNNDSNLVVGFDNETMDEFLNNTVGATNDCSNSDKACTDKQKKLLAIGRNFNERCKEIYADASIKETDPEYAKCEKFDKKFVEYAKGGYFGKGFVASSISGCTETLGSLGEWLTKIYNILLLAVPVVIMIFGFKDFMKAILNGKEDELKKAGSTFIKRLIFGAVFVALPIFIKVILSLALGGSFSDICIL